MDLPELGFESLEAISLDVEDDETGKFVGVGIFNGVTILYWSELFTHVKTWLGNQKLIAHNGNTDLHKMKKWGVAIDPRQLVFDTYIASVVTDSTRPSHALKDLSREYCGIEYPTYKQMVGSGKKKQTLDKQPVELVAAYNGMDCVATWQLAKHFEATFTESERRYFTDIEMPIWRIIWEMEDKGIKLDATKIKGLFTRFSREESVLARRFSSLVGKDFNPNSHKQVREELLLPRRIVVQSTGAEELGKRAGIPLIRDFLHYREVAKLRSTYLDPFLEKTEIHPEFYPDCETGRFNCRNPNLQNLPSYTNLIRDCFVARPNKMFVLADYSQIELRVLAHYCQDPKMLAAFRSGQDIHEATAQILKIERKVAKTINFGIVYGSGAWNLHVKTGISLAQAKKTMDRFEKEFYGIYDWKKKALYAAHRDGFVTTICGRQVKRYITKNCKKHSKKVDNKGLPCGDSCTSRLEAESDRRAISAIVQGSAADIIRIAMLKLRETGWDYLVQEHDALLFELPQELFNVDRFPLHEIQQIMTSAVDLSVPLSVDSKAGQSWGACKG